MSCFGLIWTDACFRHGLQHDMPRFSAGRLSPSPKHHLSLVAVRILQAFITSRCHAMQLDRSSNASVFGVSGIRCKLILFVAPEGCVSANVICLSAFCTIRSFLVGCRLVTMGQSISVLGLTFDWEPDWKASIGCHFQCSWHPPGIIPGILLASSWHRSVCLLKALLHKYYAKCTGRGHMTLPPDKCCTPSKYLEFAAA